MKLDIRFSNRPLEELWSQAVVALVFKTPDISSGALTGLNEKMTGALKKLLLTDKWTGDRGEKLLIATQNMIRADKLFLYGLGPVSEFNKSVLEDEIRNVGDSLDKMGIKDFGIHIPSAQGLAKKYQIHLESALKNLTEVLLNRHEDDPDYLLKIIIYMEETHLKIVDNLIKRLRQYFSPTLNFSIIFNNRQRPRAA
jgi:hypothetical protein